MMVQPVPEERVLHLHGIALPRGAAGMGGDTPDVTEEKQHDKAEHDTHEHLTVAVGHTAEPATQTGQAYGLGETAACLHLTLTALVVLRIILVGHRLPDEYPAESLYVKHTRRYYMLILGLLTLLDILVEQGAPVRDHQAVRVVLRTGNTGKLTGGNQLTGQDARATLNPLATVIGPLHRLLIEIDGVTEDTEDARRTEDIIIKTLLLQGIILGKAGLVNQIHRLIHRILDILVIRGKGEEEVVEQLHMTLRLDIKRLLHRRLLDEDGDGAVKDIHFLMGIINHALRDKKTAQADNDAAGHEQEADDQHQLDLVLIILHY